MELKTRIPQVDPNSSFKMTKAEFSWGLIPLYAMGAISMALYAVLASVPWMIGYVPTNVEDRGDHPFIPGKMFYDYKYSPTAGAYKLLAPWQYSLIVILPLGVSRMIPWIRENIALIEGVGVILIIFILLGATFDFFDPFQEQDDH